MPRRPRRITGADSLCASGRGTAGSCSGGGACVVRSPLRASTTSLSPRWACESAKTDSLSRWRSSRAVSRRSRPSRCTRSKSAAERSASEGGGGCQLTFLRAGARCDEDADGATDGACVTHCGDSGPSSSPLVEALSRRWSGGGCSRRGGVDSISSSCRASAGALTELTRLCADDLPAWHETTRCAEALMSALSGLSRSAAARRLTEVEEPIINAEGTAEVASTIVEHDFAVLVDV